MPPEDFEHRMTLVEERLSVLDKKFDRANETLDEIRTLLNGIKFLKWILIIGAGVTAWASDILHVLSSKFGLK